MRIAILWKNDYPWDVRIEKISNSLKEAGHEVYILCSNTGRLKREDIVNGLKVIRLPCVNNKKLNSLISTPFYYSPFWIKMAYRTVRQEKIDLVIVRDLPLVLVGLKLKKKYGIPVILDMAENYPAMYWNKYNKGGIEAFKNWLVKNPNLIEYIERHAVKAVDHTFVVVEESAKRLIDLGVDEKKISIVSNTPDLRIFRERGSSASGKDCLQMVYAGFVQDRGLDIVIKSLGRIRDFGVEVKFVVIGDGDFLNNFKMLAKDLQVEKMVEFKGWVKNTEIPRLIFESDIGVIPHRRTVHSDTTIPNKLFDYMACARPVIVSDARPLKRIVEEENCGLAFESGNIESFINVASQMILDRSMARRMGEKGLKAVKRRYNWAYDSMILKKVIESFKNPDVKP